MSDQNFPQRPPLFSIERRNGELVQRVADWQPGEPEPAPNEHRWRDADSNRASDWLQLRLEHPGSLACGPRMTVGDKATSHNLDERDDKAHR